MTTSSRRVRPSGARAEDHAVERIVRRTFGTLTGRSGEPLLYAVMDDTPVGALGLALGAAGLRRLTFVKDEDDFLARLLAELPGMPVLRSATSSHLPALRMMASSSSRPSSFFPG